MEKHRAKTIADNCYKLAEVMKGVSDRQHNQAWWVRETPECGTVCCAMGWACVSEHFEELKLPLNTGVRQSDGTKDYQVVHLNGRLMTIADAATVLFGAEVKNYIFGPANVSRQRVIEKLEEMGDKYCKRAKEEG